jgi:hypothetical protein
VIDEPKRRSSKSLDIYCNNINSFFCEILIAEKDLKF